MPRHSRCGVDTPGRVWCCGWCSMEVCPNIPSDRRDISFWHEEASNWWPLGTLTWISFCSAKVEESEEGNCLMPFDAIYISMPEKRGNFVHNTEQHLQNLVNKRAESLDDVVSNLQKKHNLHVLYINASCGCCLPNMIRSGSTWNFPISKISKENQPLSPATGTHPDRVTTPIESTWRRTRLACPV